MTGGPGFTCPSCGGKKTTVTDSRGREDGFKARRRRCLDCSNAWKTVEIPLDLFKQLKNKAWTYDATQPNSIEWRRAHEQIARYEDILSQIKELAG